MQNRRAFLAGLAAAGLAPQATWADAGNPSFLSAGKTPDGRYVLCGLDDRGKAVFQLALPGRGHAAAAHPNLAQAVAFARRPGQFAVVIDCARGREVSRLETPPGRHFYGHGAFSSDGRRLFTTENDFENAQGVIGIWDAAKGYQRVGEFASAGVGPHDIKLLQDDVLVVANGGIETHPDAGRSKLNIPTMRPNLAFISLQGALLDVVELDPSLHKNSIRHLGVGRNGQVAFGMQWQGNVAARVPLLGVVRRGEAPVLFDTEMADMEELAGYVGSVGVSDDAGLVGITSPRGNVAQFFDMTTGAMVAQQEVSDVCGIAPMGSSFLLTTGMGVVARSSENLFQVKSKHQIQWDNHLIPV